MNKVATQPSVNDEYLAHYGVLGMKWGVRRNPEKAYEKSKRKAEKFSAKMNKYDAKASKTFGKAANVDSRMWLFRNDKRARNLYERSRRQTAKAVRQASKGAKWIKRMEKEFAKQSVVSIEPSVQNLGKNFVDRMSSATNQAYINSVNRR